MTIQEYVDQLNRRHKAGISREHSYRGDLQSLLGDLLPDLLVTNEPKRSDVGAPDYILTKGNIPVGYIEAKDINDPDLTGKKKNKEQFSRYKDGLHNLIFTDYLGFSPVSRGRIHHIRPYCRRAGRTDCGQARKLLAVRGYHQGFWDAYRADHPQCE